MENERAVQLKFYLLQVTHWCGFGAMASFIAAFLLSNGMEKTQFSIMMAIYMLMAFLGQFVWGSICDSRQANKKVFMLTEMLVLVLYYLIYFFSNNIAFIYVLYPLLGFVLIPISSNLDSWLLKCFVHKPSVYGPSRGCSALGFGVFCLFYGKIISAVGYQIMPFVATGFIAATILIALTQPEAPSAPGSSAAKKMSAKDIAALVKIPIYILLIVMLFLIGISLSPIGNMKIVILENVGGTVEHQGYDSFFGCLVQTPFFFLAAKLKKIPQNLRILMASSSVVLMIGIDMFAKSPYVVIAADMFYFVGYSILLPTYREITENVVPANIKTTAHGLCDAVFASLAGVIALSCSGPLMDSVGVDSVIKICFAICCVGFAMSLVFVKANKKKT